jgi:hypothetical protein
MLGAEANARRDSRVPGDVLDRSDLAEVFRIFEAGTIYGSIQNHNVTRFSSVRGRRLPDIRPRFGSSLRM